MVRLAHLPAPLVSYNVYAFNPSLVRLAPSCTSSPTPKAPTLSIPAWFDWRLPSLAFSIKCNAAFNPSLVRLAPSARVNRSPYTSAFQSQLGSIGAPIASRVSRDVATFQSQLGSIGARYAGEDFLTVALFQSQLGSIGAFPPFAAQPLLAPFQSQLGSIGAATAGVGV